MVKNSEVHKKRFPVSESSFEELVKKEKGEYIYHFVDKTLFIQEILENPRRVSLITRPRRFGKSTNFNMLKWFLDIRKKAETEALFEGLKIDGATLNNGKSCMDFRGKYPVVYMNFKKLGQDNYKKFHDAFKDLMSELYLKHDYLLEGNILKNTEKSIFEKIMNKQGDGAYEFSLEKLMNYLHRHFGERVFVLIDEYDTPFQQAIHQRLIEKPKLNLEVSEKNSDYLDALKTLMGTFLGDGLKDNEDLETCVMTGIIRIAGAGIFSQLNNIDVWTVLDKPFSEYFGFTQQELDQLLIETGRTSESKNFADWYNGYEFGGNVIYNPLSVIKCLDRNEFANYWLHTSNNTLIRDSLLKPRQESDQRKINEAVAVWVSGKAIEKAVDKDLTFDSHLNTLEHLWILLISSGYLNASVSKKEVSNKLEFSLQIPNKEVLCLYRNIFIEWLSAFGVDEDSPMIQHLLRGKAEDFCTALKKFFIESLSVRDASIKQNEDEKYEVFYHGFMAAMIGLSMHKANVVLRSNRESGYGYYDLLLSPKDPNDFVYNKAVILEFKRAEEKEDIAKVAEAAFNQIIKNEYQTNIIERGVKDVVFMGIAFRGKHIEFRHETYGVDRLNVKKMGEQTESTETFLRH